MWNGCGREQSRADDIDAENIGNHLRVRIGNRLNYPASCIVDENVEASPMFLL
jgi:hypothetical protein